MLVLLESWLPFKKYSEQKTADTGDYNSVWSRAGWIYRKLLAALNDIITMK